MRGISCYFKPTIGKIKITYQDEDTIVLNSERITLIGLYIEPLTPIEDIITTIEKSTEYVAKAFQYLDAAR